MGWKHIINHRYILRKGLVWILGAGKSINFLYDNLIKDSSLVDKIYPNMRRYIVANTELSDGVTNLL